MAAPKKKYALDIFDVLKRLSLKKTEFSEEEVKHVQPLVIMRWLSGVKNQYQVFTLNEYVNPYVFNLQHHKQLLINLMTITTSGKPTRCSWLKRKSSGPSNKRVIEVISKYHGYSNRRAQEVIDILEPDTILSYASELGYQKDYIKELKKEIKKL